MEVYRLLKNNVEIPRTQKIESVYGYPYDEGDPEEISRFTDESEAKKALANYKTSRRALSSAGGKIAYWLCEVYFLSKETVDEDGDTVDVFGYIEAEEELPEEEDKEEEEC